MTVKISEMEDIASPTTNDTLIELARPIGEGRYATNSIKVGTLTRRFTFSGVFDPLNEFDSTFLSIPISQILETTGYPAYTDLTFVGIGSGTIDVHLAVSESEPTVLTNIRTGAGRYNVVYNDGYSSMLYHVAADFYTDYPIDLGSLSSNWSNIASVAPILSSITTDNLTTLDMKFKIITGTYSDPVSVPFLYHGYADVNINFKYVTPEPSSA